mgnify:CR=1 FL=1
MPKPVMYAVDFYDMIDGWIHYQQVDKSHLFYEQDVEKAIKLCDEKNAKLPNSNKNAGEHWAVWDITNRILLYCPQHRITPEAKPTKPKIVVRAKPRPAPIIIVKDGAEIAHMVETVGTLKKYLSSIENDIPILFSVAPEKESFGAKIIRRSIPNPDTKLKPIEMLIICSQKQE